MIQVLIRPRFEALVAPEEIERVAHTVLQMESAPLHASLSVVITDDDEIQSLNRRTPETGKWLRQALDEWLAAVESDDERAFTSLMQECHGFLDGASDDRAAP